MEDDNSLLREALDQANDALSHRRCFTFFRRPIDVTTEPAWFECKISSCCLDTAAEPLLPRNCGMDADGRAMPGYGFPNHARDHDGQPQKQTPPEASFATTDYSDARLQRERRGEGRKIMVTHGQLRGLQGKT